LGKKCELTWRVTIFGSKFANIGWAFKYIDD
jgi:hypothetical protein